MEPVLIILLCVGIFLVILSPFIIYWIRFVNKFKTIEIGMSYSEVIGIMGPPRTRDEVDSIIACTWKIHPLRNVYITKTIFFKDGKVYKFSED